MRLIASLLATALAAEIVDHGERWWLADPAPTARHTRFDSVEINGNHIFYDHRIALESDMLAWLDKLSGARAR